MTSTALRPTRLPYLGRLVLVPAGAAHAFALAGLVIGWAQYRQPAAAAGLLVLSAALPVALVVLSRRAGGMPPRPVAALIVTGVFAVSVAVPALLPPGDRASWASWNWSAGAMTLLGVAAYLPTAVTLLLATGHGALAVGTLLQAGGGAWGAELALFAAVVPPLAAAEYLRYHADALRSRADAGASRLRARAGERELDAVALAEVRRLSVLREEIRPLLAEVAGGAALPLDDATALDASRLAERLRSALAARRRTLWLPDRIGTADVTVIATDTVAAAVGGPDRSWLAGLLDLLADHPGWLQIRVVLDGWPGDRTAPGQLGVLVAAAGSAVVEAAADPRVQALCATRTARCEVDDGFLIVETDVVVTNGSTR